MFAGAKFLVFFEIYFFCSFFPWIWVISKSSSTTSMWGNTPIGGWSRNLSWYIAEVHRSVTHRCTHSSATTLHNLLQNLIRSVLCFIIRHDVIINDSLKPDCLSLCVADLMVSSKTLLNAIPCLSKSTNTLRLDWLS